MAIVEPQTPPASAAVAPTSVQPGGGLCVNIELAWGRLRRAWLRRLRPGYVQRMHDKRQGYCPDCPHDIIDPRDLKFCRNVCGYWFRPEDDHFRWRGRLGLARAGFAEVVCFSLLFLSLAVLTLLGGFLLHGSMFLVLPVVMFFWFESVYFFRDPERKIPTDPTLLLSPADGRVTHIEEVDEADFPSGRALRISIFLSVFSVHINRVPRTGRIIDVRYFPGCFLDARRPDCAVRNEQLWIELQEESPSPRRIRVKQISGAIARRIVCWLKVGESVRAGERLGMIKFGSRTDVLVPAGNSVKVIAKVGDAVHGGSSPLLQFLN